jgi:hypothetical protein
LGLFPFLAGWFRRRRDLGRPWLAQESCGVHVGEEHFEAGFV